MNIRRWLITLLVCLLALAGLGYFKFAQISAAIEKGKAYPEPSATVRASAASMIEFRPSMELVGELLAPRRLELRNELAGKIAKINFTPGAEVSAGQLLLQLDVSEEQARLKAARANVKLAKLTLERNKKLRANNRVSAEAYDRAVADYQNRQAEARRLEVIINKKTMVAPFAARAGLHNFEVGQYLQQNTLITTLIGLDEYLWVDFKMPQDRAQLGRDSHIEVIGQAGGQPLRAELLAQDSSVSSSSRQLRYRARFKPDPKQPLQAGSIVTVRIASGAERQLASVPDVSLSRDQFGEYVYVLQPQEQHYRAERRSIQSGPRSGSRIVILSGLEAGELVANEGAFKLRQGLKVFIDKEPKRTAPAQTSEEAN
ncbi:MAG: efflux RND transporter periplasmic adaptor subunit [Cellvibrionaceae bacterium]|nr:efflux RND transporter periplasmic adaptor subunit [Cellvibrionaceae bacterium]MCV6626257.1 efflux RND transporter periplasmic adaptor subunit [Cellvibrionaceae bacterium]